MGTREARVSSLTKNSPLLIYLQLVGVVFPGVSVGEGEQ